MELILKASSAAVLTAVVGLLLRRHNPELALLLGAASALSVLLASLGMLNGLSELKRLSRQMIGGAAEVFLSPVLKCLAVSIVSRFASETCRDASQHAAASAVDFAGAVCSLCIVMPLLLSVLKIVGGVG